MKYAEIMEITNDILEYIGENYNLTYDDLIRVVDRLGDMVSYIAECGCPIEDDLTE